MRLVLPYHDGPIRKASPEQLALGLDEQVGEMALQTVVLDSRRSEGLAQHVDQVIVAPAKTSTPKLIWRENSQGLNQKGSDCFAERSLALRNGSDHTAKSGHRRRTLDYKPNDRPRRTRGILHSAHQVGPRVRAATTSRLRSRLDGRDKPPETANAVRHGLLGLFDALCQPAVDPKAEFVPDILSLDLRRISVLPDHCPEGCQDWQHGREVGCNQDSVQGLRLPMRPMAEDGGVLRPWIERLRSEWGIL